MEGSEIWISFRRMWISFRRTLILFRLVLISFRWILNSFHASWRLERGGAWARFGVAAGHARPKGRPLDDREIRRDSRGAPEHRGGVAGSPDGACLRRREKASQVGVSPRRAMAG